MTVGCCDWRAQKAGREPATFQNKTSERAPTSAVTDEFKANAPLDTIGHHSRSNNERSRRISYYSLEPLYIDNSNNSGFLVLLSSFAQPVLTDK